MCSSLFKSNPSLGNLLLLGTCVGIVFFVCVVICLRAFSWELASVVDFFGVIYLRSSLFRSLLLEISSGKNKLCFFGVFSWEIWIHRISGWCGLLFPIYIFLFICFLFFRYTLFCFLECLLIHLVQENS